MIKVAGDSDPEVEVSGHDRLDMPVVDVRGDMVIGSALRRTLACPPRSREARIDGIGLVPILTS